MDLAQHLAIRLAAAKLAPGRFAGRAALERAAEHDPFALAQLERLVGLDAPPDRVSQAERVLLARCEARERGRDVAQALRVLREAEDAVERARRSPGTYDPGAYEALLSAARRDVRAAQGRGASGPVVERSRVERAIITALGRATAEAGLRTATHAHVDEYVFVSDSGRIDAVSESGSAWPREVGLPNAYAKKGFRVATSTHRWTLYRGCTPWAEDGYVYLHASVRVRSGRGTSLVVERLGTNARGRVAWL